MPPVGLNNSISSPLLAAPSQLLWCDSESGILAKPLSEAPGRKCGPEDVPYLEMCLLLLDIMVLMNSGSNLLKRGFMMTRQPQIMAMSISRRVKSDSNTLDAAKGQSKSPKFPTTR
jgi:hypothetical protein